MEVVEKKVDDTPKESVETKLSNEDLRKLSKELGINLFSGSEVLASIKSLNEKRLIRKEIGLSCFVFYKIIEKNQFIDC